MAAPAKAAPKRPLTVQERKQKVQHKIIKPKPGAAPVALTNSDVKNAIKGWIDNQLKLWMARVSSTQDAINQADMAFQDIMAHKTTPPIVDTLLEKLVIGVAMAVAPEFSGAALVFKQIVNDSELYQKAAETIADVTKEGVAEIKKSLTEYKDEEDKASSQELAVHFFQKLYKRVGSIRDRATIVNVKLTHYIDVGISSNDPKLEDKLNEVLGVWCDAGLQTDESTKIDSYQLSLLFLYDLMRAYCRQNVKLVFTTHMISTTYDLDGLDEARQKAMFEHLSHIKWHDVTRPPIKNWDTLMYNWRIDKR